MTRIAVTGYASLDHVAMLDGVPRAGRTTTILRRPDDAWPRLGGSPAYVAAALVSAGVPNAFPVCWVGNDAEGADYRSQLARGSIPDAGVATVDGMRTPVAVLAYEPDGGCVCLYDPGSAEGSVFCDGQRELLSSCDWICITIGPPSTTEAIVNMIGADTRLAWVVKDDPRSMPVPLAARIAARADLIIASKAESAFLGEALSAAAAMRRDAIVIETEGGSGASLKCGGRHTFVATSPIEVNDPTGAGDTFAGGVLAALAKGQRDPEEMLKAGHRAAAALLSTRRDMDMEGIAQ